LAFFRFLRLESNGVKQWKERCIDRITSFAPTNARIVKKLSPSAECGNGNYDSKSHKILTFHHRYALHQLQNDIKQIIWSVYRIWIWNVLLYGSRDLVWRAGRAGVLYLFGSYLVLFDRSLSVLAVSFIFSRRLFEEKCPVWSPIYYSRPTLVSPLSVPHNERSRFAVMTACRNVIEIQRAVRSFTWRNYGQIVYDSLHLLYSNEVLKLMPMFSYGIQEHDGTRWDTMWTLYDIRESGKWQTVVSNWEWKLSPNVGQFCY